MMKTALTSSFQSLPKKFKIICHHDLESGIEEPYSPHKYREKREKDKGKEKKKMIIALKVKSTYSKNKVDDSDEEESSSGDTDEEITLFVRRFGKFSQPTSPSSC